jgi:GNAT superfamily N-acetyltransferase
MTAAAPTPITVACDECGADVTGPTLDAFSDAFLAHVRTVHADWPYPDIAVRNYGEAHVRLTGRTERLESISSVAVEPVTPERLDDWLSFFDHDAFAGNPAWAACYCSEPHQYPRGAAPEDVEFHTWRHNRELMIELIGAGKVSGYLAYVDGTPGGWVNASTRDQYTLYALGPDADPADADVVAVSCFTIAPPYRRHGLAARLLDRVVADAAGRGATWIEGYPSKSGRTDDAGNFKGPRSLYEERGFEPVDERERDTVMRRRA